MSHALIDPASGAGSFMQGEGGATLSRIVEAVAPYAESERTQNGPTPPCGLVSRDALLIPLEERAGRFDVVITNPPFSGNTAETKSAGSTLNTSKSELLFLEHVLSSLRPGGHGCVLVPGGVLFGSGKAHVEVRRRLIEENNLRAVVHVPAGAFKPYAGSATSVLLFTAGPPVTQSVWFDEITTLGYSLDNRRRPTGEDDVPAVLERWRARHGQEGGRQGTGFFVPVEELRENDFILQLARYREFVMPTYEGPSVEELMIDIVRIELETQKHMRELAAMLGMSYEEMMRRAMESPAAPDDRAAAET